MIQIFRRNRAAVQAKKAQIAAADKAYRQQFIDAAEAEASAKDKPPATTPPHPASGDQRQQKSTQQPGNRR